MKKKQLFFLFTLFCSNNIFGQTSALLDTNNISAKVTADGKLFDGQFEVPKGSGKHTIYTGNIWIGGLDAGGQLHIAAQTYAQSGADFFYGPIATNYTSAPYPATYNKVWKVRKSTINYHIANFTTGGYSVPASIANWPGNGNITNGEAAVLAPYMDVNSNNMYDPANGDYPAIRGDQAIFYMVNDDKQAHGETGGTKLGIEVHGMVYSYASTTDSALNQTVFVNYEIFNRSINNYDSIYFGAWSDMDLGDYMDDYVGSDSLLNMYYTYNADNADGGAGGYGTAPPAQGSVFLNKPISKFVYYNNDASPLTGNPAVALDYYNYLKGRWKDDTPMTYGGTGYGGSTPSDFMFSGKPELGTGWTENSVGNAPADRRGIISVGPFNLLAGDMICVDIAYPFARDYAGTNLTSVALLRQRVQSIQSFYNSQGYLCQFPIGITENRLQNNDATIYPNPSNGLFYVKYDPATSLRVTRIEVMNMLGEKIYSTQINSHGSSAPITEIDLSKQSKGIYFYQIKSEQRILKTGKIIIN